MSENPASTNVFPEGGNVGIGTTTPGANLAIEDLEGVVLHLRRDAHNEWFLVAPKGSDKLGLRMGANHENNERVTILTSGNVGIGTTTPGANLAIEDLDGVVFHLRRDAHNEWFLVAPKGSDKLGFRTGSNADANERVTFLASGNVGIGTQTPREKLEVDGNILVSGDVLLPGADCAEEFDVKNKKDLQPGSVMVIGDEYGLEQSSVAYDKRVAGVLSGAGEYRPGIILGKEQTKKERLPLALVGKVFCKVDASYSSIKVGDLLTSSPTPGHAMKASDPLKAFGAIIGKALRPFTEGQGLIPILVTLH